MFAKRFELSYQVLGETNDDVKKMALLGLLKGAAAAWM
jgi:hypothetical protein